MTTFIIETFDSDISYGIWNLKTKGVDIEESLRKAEGFPSEITAYVELGATLLTFATALFELIKTKQKNKPNKTKTIIHTRKENVDLIKLIKTYEESIHIEIKEEDSERNRKGDGSI